MPSTGTKLRIYFCKSNNEWSTFFFLVPTKKKTVNMRILIVSGCDRAFSDVLSFVARVLKVVPSHRFFSLKFEE